MTLTRGGVALVALTLFLLWQSASTAATIFVVVAFLIAVLAVNVPYAFLAVRGIGVRRDHPSHVKEGSELAVRLRVHNAARSSRILLRLFDRGPGEDGPLPVQVPFLPALGTAEATYACRAGRRGVYRYAACRVESSSPFGLVNAWRQVRAVSDLVVYPLFYELAGAGFPFLKTYTGMTAAPGSRPGEGPSFFGLREYREGDPIRKIHWPSSLRARTLIVKEFEEDMHSSVMLLLDTRAASVTGRGDTNLEVAVRVVASLANHTLVNGHPVTLSWFDRAARCLRRDVAVGDLTPVLDSLARLEPGPSAPTELIAGAAAAAAAHANWIVVLLSADHDALEALLRARSQGIEVLLVIVDEHGAAAPGRRPPWFADMLGLLESAGICTLLMSPRDDVQACLSRYLRSSRGAGRRAYEAGKS